MRILCISGSHLRHLYFINAIAKRYGLVGAIIETREDIIPKPPDDIPEIDRVNFIRHFQKRDEAEKKYFGNQELPECQILETRESDLNSSKSVQFIRDRKPDIVLVFGCSMIRDPLYSALPEETINLHLGLSPRYRGSATLFWPFYFMEPSYAGSTFHYIVSEPDAGNIIHQVVPKLDMDDGIHDVACKTVVQSVREATSLIDIYREKGGFKRFPQRGTGKNFLVSDFRPEHLRVIYNLFDDDIVRHYLNGNLKCKKPNIITQPMD